MNVIENLLGKDIDSEFADVPKRVRADVGERDVVAAAYVQGKKYEYPAHLVVYYRGVDDETNLRSIPADDKHWAVGLLVHNDEMQQSVLTDGDYDLTFAEAMAVFVRRVERQG